MSEVVASPLANTVKINLTINQAAKTINNPMATFVKSLLAWALALGLVAEKI